MCELQLYKCVNCGAFAHSLYKSYGPSVLKLSKCRKCGGVVDKYVEYDPVIIMIDLVLMSQEAQRHFIYNRAFKSCWKLMIMLMMLETYSLWKNDSLFTMGVSAVCGFNINHNNSTVVLSHDPNTLTDIEEPWKSYCLAWTQHGQGIENDLFIWEKDFYVLFISVTLGVTALLVTSVTLMKLFSYITAINHVSLEVVLKCQSLWWCHVLLGVPALVWGAGGGGTAPGLWDLAGKALPLLCGLRAAGLLYGVAYRSNLLVTSVVLATSVAAKVMVTFAATSYIRGFVS